MHRTIRLRNDCNTLNDFLVQYRKVDTQRGHLTDFNYDACLSLSKMIDGTDPGIEHAVAEVQRQVRHHIRRTFVRRTTIQSVLMSFWMICASVTSAAISLTPPVAWAEENGSNSGQCSIRAGDKFRERARRAKGGRMGRDP